MGKLYPARDIPGTTFVYKLSLSRGHSAVGRISYTKNHQKPVGNKTRNFPTFSEVPTVLPRIPEIILSKYIKNINLMPGQVPGNDMNCIGVNYVVQTNVLIYIY
jgi:hypothetical protein